MYNADVIAGCPFAARPWAVVSFYGLPIQIVKLFPSSYEDGWFFTPKSDGEKELTEHFPQAQIDEDPLYNCTHLKELYLKANPNYKGAISVPLLWDKVNETAVSNSSLGISQMLATQMKCLATRNQDVDLFPITNCGCDDNQDGDPKTKEMIKDIHSRISVYCYKLNASTLAGKERDQMIDRYYDTLTEYQTKLQQLNDSTGDDNKKQKLENGAVSSNGSDSNGKSSSITKFLLETSTPTFVDILLWISLIRYDLAYQWRFGLGKYSIREDYPTLQNFIQCMMSPKFGLCDTVLPRDIMALYFMTLNFSIQGKGRALPHVPSSWMKQIYTTNGNSN